jgi:hypothetical protein
MISQNLKITKNEMDSINEAFPLTDAMTAYNTARQKIYADANIVSQAQFDALDHETRLSITSKVDALNAESAATLAEFEKMNTEKLEFLKEEIDLPLKTVTLDLVPDIAEKNELNHWYIWETLQLYIEDAQ